MGFSLAIVDAVSPSVSVGGLLTLSRKVTTWTLGLLMSVFLGVLSMQNLISGSTDTAAAKTTRYVLSNFVPVVGSAVSDAYATVRGSLQILRSTTGVLGIMALCLLFLPPLLQLLLYRRWWQWAQQQQNCLERSACSACYVGHSRRLPLRLHCWSALP